MLIGSQRRIVRFAGALMSATSTIAVSFTYTRSAILSVVVVLAGIAIACACFARSRLPKLGVFALIVTSVFSLTVTAFGLQDIYFNRFLQLSSALSVFGSGRPAQLRPAPSQIPSEPLSESQQPTNNAESQPVFRDANVDARIAEYRVALDMFQGSPFFGVGFGAKHTINFDTGAGGVLHQNVSYLHNWPLYMLKTGGLFGFALYIGLLAAITYMALKATRFSLDFRVALCATVAFLAVYGLFFASFRLIGFNLLLASILGVALAGRVAHRNLALA
jgi:O-antigen ligase